MFQVNYLPPMGKHPSYLLVVHSTLRNKLVVHDVWQVEKNSVITFPFGWSYWNFKCLSNNGDFHMEHAIYWTIQETVSFS
jgi:hypothetical protein